MYTEDWCPYCESLIEGDIVWGEYEMLFICNEGHESVVNYEDTYDPLTHDTEYIQRYYGEE